MLRGAMRWGWAGLVIVGLTACGGRMPDDLGPRGAGLAGCPDSPNCVSSAATESDAQHAITAFAIRGDAREAWAALVESVEAMPRTEIVRNERGYLHAVQTSRLMRYRDDFEFLLDASAGRIRVRSASRVGYGDMGVNRERIERIRAALAEAGVVAGSDAA